MLYRIFKKKQDDKITNVKKGTILLLKFIGLSITGLAVGATFPVTAPVVAPILFLLERIFNTSTKGITDMVVERMEAQNSEAQ